LGGGKKKGAEGRLSNLTGRGENRGKRKKVNELCWYNQENDWIKEKKIEKKSNNVQ